MNRFIFTLQFLSIFTLNKNIIIDENKISSTTVYFPVVGLIIGIILVGIYYITLPYIPETLLNLLLIIILIIITRGLHIDGLADTCDGFFGGYNKEKRLLVMRDSHIGTFGVIAIIIDIILKYKLLSLCSPKSKFIVLLLFPVISRYTMLIPLTFFSYARSDGKAKSFFDGMKPLYLLIGTLITLSISYYTVALFGIMLVVICFIISLIISYIMKRFVDGHTGDTLGALNEIMEIVCILTMILMIS